MLSPFEGLDSAARAGHAPAGIETPASEDMVGGNDHNLYPSSLALKALAPFGKAQQKDGINAESNNGAALPESANPSIRTLVGSQRGNEQDACRLHRPAGSLTELMFRRPSEVLNEIYSHYLPIGLKPPEQR